MKENTKSFSKKSNIKTEYIYIDDSYFDNLQFFPKPSTDDRKDFEIKVGRDDLLVYKSPMLTTVNISRKNLKDVLNNILEDLNPNIGDSQTNIEQKIDKKELQKSKNLLTKLIQKKSNILKIKLTQIFE